MPASNGVQPPGLEARGELICHPLRTPFLQDLSGFSRGELQVFCREHSLYAGGSHAELEARINDSVFEGREVLVYLPAREDWREGVICRVLRQG